MKTLLFTCCNGAGGWSILRSLEGTGRFRLIGVDTDALSAGIYQPGLSARYLVPPGDHPDYVSALLSIVDQENVDVVWPCSDEEVIALSTCRKLFAEHGAKLVVSDPSVISRATDKLEMVRLLDPLGIKVPKSASLSEDLSDFSFPVIVRPRQARGGKEVYFFNAESELDTFRTMQTAALDRWFVQEKITASVGSMHMVSGLYDERQILNAFFMSRSIKTVYPWGGPALGGAPVENNALKELGLAVFKASGPWYGPVNAEFLWSESDKTFYFIEINPRYWGYSYLATAAGVNFPDLTVKLALGEQVEPCLDYATDIVTVSSREQVAINRQSLLRELP